MKCMLMLQLASRVSPSSPLLNRTHQHQHKHDASIAAANFKFSSIRHKPSIEETEEEERGGSGQRKNWRVLHRTTSVAELACLLKRCGRAKALSDGRLLHALIRRYGHDSDTFLGNWLVQMYGDCGNMHEAKAAFNRLPYPNLYSFTILMKAYIKNGCNREALSVFDRMMLCGILPDHVAFVCAIEACAALGALKKGQEVHAAVVENGCEKMIIVGNALISMYGKCRSLKVAKDVFSRMYERNEASWNAMIRACVQNFHSNEALELFDLMQCKGMIPSRITFLCALDACASISALEKGYAIHSAIVEGGYEGHLIVATALVNMYGKCGSLEDARTVFGRITKRDVICWNAMIAACSQNGHCIAALDLLNDMQHEGVNPNDVTFICALDACASLKLLEKGQNIHAAMLNSPYEKSVLVSNALINMYGKCGSLEKARKVFHQILQKDAISWNSMLATCAQNGESAEALSLFDAMQREGFKPNRITFVCALEACAQLAALDQGQKIHAVIVDYSYALDVLIGNALLSMYGKCGSLADARRVFDQMPCRDVVSWSAMIEACAVNGQGSEALKLLLLMQNEGIYPNGVTALSILSACSHTENVDHGQHCFGCINPIHGVNRGPEHYASVIDSLSRAGYLDVAGGSTHAAT